MTPKTLVRRRGLIEWLESHGFTEHQVDGLIDAGVLDDAQVHIPHRRRKSAARPSRSKSVPKAAGGGAKASLAGEVIEGRAFYRTAKVAQILRLTP